MAGYSNTPLAKKLGIKPGFIIKVVNAPGYYFKLLTDLPDGIKQVTDTTTKKDFIHYFCKDSKSFIADIKQLKKEIKPDGMIWLSWPKKASKVVTDVTEDIVRNVSLKNGLVDIKVCAFDETWSGLKVVIPVKDRVK